LVIDTQIKHNASMLDVRRLRYFLEVAETLHFTRAAQSLGVSQQPLSRAIAELEEELGARLFERTTRHVALTPAGEALKEQGQLALRQLVLAERCARDNGQLVLRVVYPGTVGDFPHSVIENFTKRRGVAVKLALVRSHEQERLVLRGEADIAFVVPPSLDDRLSWRSVLRVSMRVAVRRDDPLAKKRVLRLQELSESSWISYSKHTKRALGEFVRALQRGVTATPRRGSEAADEADAIRLVSQGHGIAVVSETARCGREVLLRSLTERPHIEIAAVWRRGDQRPEVAWLVDALAV
jgi:DNA-binding transcriptional LysR family regulator